MNKTANRNQDSLDKFKNEKFLQQAQAMLHAQELSEEAFLGAQAVMLLNGAL